MQRNKGVRRGQVVEEGTGGRGQIVEGKVVCEEEMIVKRRINYEVEVEQWETCGWVRDHLSGEDYFTELTSSQSHFVKPLAF